MRFYTIFFRGRDHEIVTVKRVVYFKICTLSVFNWESTDEENVSFILVIAVSRDTRKSTIACVLLRISRELFTKPPVSPIVYELYD